MSENALGWTIIGIAIVLGALRLLNVIDNVVLAVLGGALVIFGGAIGAALKKKKQEKSESGE